VISGVGATVEPSSVDFPGGVVSYGFEVTVPAGGRAIVLHFASQSWTRADAVAKAQTLRELGGSALVGISAEEAGDVVNFLLP
jgi:hypothetical protein